VGWPKTGGSNKRSIPMCFLVTFQSFVWVKGLIVGHHFEKA
jgi:hypothetical protein